MSKHTVRLLFDKLLSTSPREAISLLRFLLFVSAPVIFCWREMNRANDLSSQHFLSFLVFSFSLDSAAEGQILKTVTGEEVCVRKAPDMVKLASDLQVW